MNIGLPARLLQWVQDQVQAGRFESPAEVVAEAVRLMADREDSHRELREKIESGWRQLERGEVVDGEAAFAELENRMARRRKRSA